MDRKIVTLEKGRDTYSWMRCNFCFEKKDVQELRFTRHDGNGHIFHVCKDCMDKIKKEIGEING